MADAEAARTAINRVAGSGIRIGSGPQEVNKRSRPTSPVGKRGKYFSIAELDGLMRKMPDFDGVGNFSRTFTMGG
jgi:hypothetical protein